MGEEPGGMRRKHLKEIKQNTPKHTHTNTDRKTRKTEKQWREKAGQPERPQEP